MLHLPPRNVVSCIEFLVAVPVALSAEVESLEAPLELGILLEPVVLLELEALLEPKVPFELDGVGKLDRPDRLGRSGRLDPSELPGWGRLGRALGALGVARVLVVFVPVLLLPVVIPRPILLVRIGTNDLLLAPVSGLGRELRAFIRVGLAMALLAATPPSLLLVAMVRLLEIIAVLLGTVVEIRLGKVVLGPLGTVLVVALLETARAPNGLADVLVSVLMSILSNVSVGVVYIVSISATDVSIVIVSTTSPVDTSAFHCPPPLY